MIRGTEGDRGQTSVDFLTGMSIFALTIVFMIQFTSGSMVTVSTDNTEKQAIADRTAAILYSNELSEEDLDDGVLSEEGASNNFSDYKSNYQVEFRDALAIPEVYTVNATVRYADTGDLVVADPGSVQLNTPSDETAVPNTTASIASTKRVAYMQGPNTNETVVIHVRVW